MDDQINELSAYIGLLVQQAGGEVRIPHEVVEQGLPLDSGIKVTNDNESEELVFALVKREDGQ